MKQPQYVTFLRLVDALEGQLLTRGQFNKLCNELLDPSTAIPQAQNYCPNQTARDWSSDFTVPGVDFEMIRIEAGSFQMGSPDNEADARDDEQPQHTVQLSRAFQLGKVPVTQELWRAVMGSNPSKFTLWGEPHPVENVSWFDCVRFCNQLSANCGLNPAYTIGSGDEPTVSWDRTADGFRLPTEAEWEYAARAGEDTLYAGSSEMIGEVAWHGGNSGYKTHAVGGKAANAWGLYDMSGNVWEWCWDWFGEETYQSGSSVDPVGHQSGAFRVGRGGCWRSLPQGTRLTRRIWCSPGDRNAILGFRIARTIIK